MAAFGAISSSECLGAKFVNPTKNRPSAGHQTSLYLPTPAVGRLRSPVRGCSLGCARGSGRVLFVAVRRNGLHWHNRPASSDNRPAHPWVHVANSSALAGSSPNCERQSSVSDAAGLTSGTWWARCGDTRDTNRGSSFRDLHRDQPAHSSSSNRAFASFRSGVSKPSVNQL
jgi:hypothetical protein